jgi:ribonuclease-3
MSEGTSTTGDQADAENPAPVAALTEAMPRVPAFNNPKLLERALTHTSFANENPGVADNERLEFLGDSVLNHVVAAWLFRTLPELGEGRLTTMRAALVRAERLAAFAEEIGLPACLRLGKGEAGLGGKRRTNILADAFEALTAALYLDHGMGAVQALLEPLIERVGPELLAGAHDRDPKTRFQEWSQGVRGTTPRYALVASEGPAHALVFSVELWIGTERVATGQGPSKQAAEQAAASAALLQLAPAEKMQAGPEPAG